MSTWSIELFQSGDTFIPDGTIPRPNEQVETQRTSSMQTVKLADGSNAFINPETKYTKEPFQMFFADANSTFRTQIETYITNGDKLKIITHTGEQFIGKFTSMQRVWLTGISPDSYDLQVMFTQTS